MADNNLDDLILTDPEPEKGKSKGLLALLALVVLLIIIGAVLAKMIFSSPEDSNATNVADANSSVVASSETSTIDNAKDDSLNNNDTSTKSLDSDLSPLDDKEMPANVDTVSLDEKEKVNSAKESSKNDSELLTSKPQAVSESVTEHNKKIMEAVAHKNVTKTSHKEEVKVTHKVTKPKKTQHKTAKTKHTYGGAGNIYVQVGSFSKGPEQSFINKIRRAGFRFRIKEVNGFRRVLVGPFRNNAEVNRVLPIIKSKISSDVIIKR